LTVTLADAQQYAITLVWRFQLIPAHIHSST
jgi:hypothetical protein